MVEQLALFANLPAEPEGLRYVPDFITAPVEQKLISAIQALPLQPFQFGEFEGKRRVVSFGFSFDYASRRLQPAQHFPAWLADTLAAVQLYGGPSTRIRQILCTEYDVGVGIGWHRDRPEFKDIFGLSLGSACTLQFRRRSGKAWDRFSLRAEPRSLYVLSGASRRAWEHGILGVASPRYSITFRTMSNDATS